MKNPHSETESAEVVDSLRAEVRELREAVAGLEAKLSEFEEDETGEENPWDVWPYCWFTAAWSYTQNRFQSFQLQREQRELERHHERNRQFAESEHNLLHVVQ